MSESKAIREVTDQDFETSVVQATTPTFVDFWAPWCAPCRTLGPIVEDLASHYEGRVVMAKVNVDDNPDVAQKYQISSIPALLMFKDGKVVDRAVGALPRGELQKFIERNL